MIARTIIAWFVILLVAVLNGGVREKFVRPHLGDFAAELVGAAILSLACFLAAILVMRAAGPNWQGLALRVGLTWLLMTVAFEFGFFHYVGGRSWSELLGAYRFWEGRLWIVVLISTFIAPFAAGKWTACR